MQTNALKIKDVNLPIKKKKVRYVFSYLSPQNHQAIIHNKSKIKIIVSKMQRLGAQTIDQIQKLITTPTPTKGKSTSAIKKISKEENTSPFKEQKTPEKKKYKNIKEYHPLEKQNQLMNRQVQANFKEMEYQHTHRVQNKHSFFLNSRNPKAPLYQRARYIVEEREMMLQEKRRQLQRLKQEKEDQQYEKFLAEVPPKKTISKAQAQKLSERLYRDHYSKLNRLNQQKMQRLKQETKIFREKPQISQNSKEIFQVLKDKEHLQKDVFNRFQNYNIIQGRKQAQVIKNYNEKYLPFKPVISQNSKILSGARTDRQELSRSQHCNSCISIKNQKSKSNITYSPNKSAATKMYQKESSLNITQFNAN